MNTETQNWMTCVYTYICVYIYIYIVYMPAFFFLCLGLSLSHFIALRYAVRDSLGSKSTACEVEVGIQVLRNSLVNLGFIGFIMAGRAPKAFGCTW